MKITAVIVAGGKGTRMGADKNKVFLKILGREVLYYTILAFEKNDKIDDIIVVTGKNDIEECQILVDKYDIKKVSYITEGGATRQESVMNGLKKAEGDIVLIHDGARALVTDDEINNSVADCIKLMLPPGASKKDLDKRVKDKTARFVYLNKEKDEINGEIKLNEDIKAPIAKGDTLGTITYNSDGIEYTANVIAANDVQKSNLILNILRILLVIVLLLLTYLYLKNKRKCKINKKHKKANYVYK